MTRRIASAFALSVLLLAGTTGCSEAPPRSTQIPASPGSSLTESDFINVVTVNVNGRNVVCVAWDGFQTGGLSCDWANAKP